VIYNTPVRHNATLLFAGHPKRIARIRYMIALITSIAEDIGFLHRLVSAMRIEVVEVLVDWLAAAIQNLLQIVLESVARYIRIGVSDPKVRIGSDHPVGRSWQAKSSRPDDSTNLADLEEAFCFATTDELHEH